MTLRMTEDAIQCFKCRDESEDKEVREDQNTLWRSSTPKC